MSGARPGTRFDSPEALAAGLARQAYVTDADLQMTVYLAMTPGRPLPVEGPAGVGKTEIARAQSRRPGTAGGSVIARARGVSPLFIER